MGYYYSAYTNKPKIKSIANDFGYYEIDDESSRHSFLTEKRSSYCLFLILEHLNLRAYFEDEKRKEPCGIFLTIEDIHNLIKYIKEDIVKGTKKLDEIERWKSINTRGNYPVEDAINSDVEFFEYVITLAKEKYCYKVFITFD